MDDKFVEHGYRPKTEVIDALDQSVFHNPTHADVIHFFKSESSTVPELQQAIQATVLISQDKFSPGGSGVIVNYKDRKYLITATHVIGGLIADKEAEERYYYRDNSGRIQEGILRHQDMLYDSTTARERDLPSTDVAIFPFNGDNDGVEVSSSEVGYESDQIASAIGFPGEFHDAWRGTLKPLISVGRMFKRKPQERTPAMQAILEQHMRETGEKEGPDLNIYYTGRSVPGNSGGPLVDETGKALGVCHGPRGSLGKEDGIDRYSDFRPVLDVIAERRQSGV